jgi:hypothetical protein
MLGIMEAPMPADILSGALHSLLAQTSSGAIPSAALDIFAIVRSVIIALVLLFFGFAFYVFLRIWPMRRRLHIYEGIAAYREMPPTEVVDFTATHREVIRRQWIALLRRIEEGTKQSLPLAVVEADRLMDQTLKQFGYPGENFGERLRGLPPGTIANLDALWNAHRLRNRIAHEPGAAPTRDEVLEALGAYKKAFDDLGVF